MGKIYPGTHLARASNAYVAQIHGIQEGRIIVPPLLTCRTLKDIDIGYLSLGTRGLQGLTI